MTHDDMVMLIYVNDDNDDGYVDDAGNVEKSKMLMTMM